MSEEKLFDLPEPEQEEEVSDDIFDINEKDLTEETKMLDSASPRIKQVDLAKINYHMSI